MSPKQYYLVPSRTVYTGVVVVLLTIALGILNAVIRVRNMPENSVDTIIDGYLTSIPVVPRPVALKYEENRHPSEDDQIDWNTIFPPGRGFVRLDQGRETYFAVALYHQIHCLNNLEVVFRSAANGSMLHVESHLMHCFGYLRQLALCAADTTLEPSETMVDQHGQVRHIVYGNGATHQCRDWRQVWEYAAENYETWKDKDYFSVAKGTGSHHQRREDKCSSC